MALTLEDPMSTFNQARSTSDTRTEDCVTTAGFSQVDRSKDPRILEGGYASRREATQCSIPLTDSGDLKKPRALLDALYRLRQIRFPLEPR